MAWENIENQKFKTLKMDDQMLARNYKFIERDLDGLEFLINWPNDFSIEL